MDMDDDGYGLDDALAVGAGYGLYRHGQDRQTAEIINALRNDSLLAGLAETDDDLGDEVIPAPNILDYVDDQPTDVLPRCEIDERFWQIVDAEGESQQ